MLSLKGNADTTDPPPITAVSRDAWLLARRSERPETCMRGSISTVLAGAAGIFSSERYISGWVKDEKRPSDILRAPDRFPDTLDDLLPSSSRRKGGARG
jgi:hypothetical protein